MFNIFNKNKKMKDVKFPSEIGNFKEEKKEGIEENTNGQNQEIKEEWIWVEGYKGTNKDMKCRDIKYQLNKTFKHDGNIQLCDRGFHFCKEFKDVFRYYNLDMNNRFFKVKGLVNKDAYNNIKENNISYHPYGVTYNDSKLAAKEIVFLEELSYDVLKEIIKENMPLIDSEEEYNSYKDYNEFCKNKFLVIMKELGFSDLYSQIKRDSIINKNNIIHREVTYMNMGRPVINTTPMVSRNFTDDLYQFLKKAKAYREENISKDLMIYLLEQI